MPAPGDSDPMIRRNVYASDADLCPAGLRRAYLWKLH